MECGKRQVRCARGHLTTRLNTYVYPDGKERCRECLKEYHRKCRTNPRSWEKEKARIREYNLERKIEVLTHYGFNRTLRCCWRGCNVTDVDMLSLDHSANDGAIHRRSLNNGSSEGGGSSVYADVKRRKFPKGFETLCCNHQMKKEILRRRAVNGSTN